MCGIFGYIGKPKPLSLFIDGLSRLEYRGYDSCGIAAVTGKKFFLKKRTGKIAQLKQELKKVLGRTYPNVILHTRWATHGRPTRINAHPHFDTRKDIAVVHNGIIENYLSLKEELKKKGAKFVSETDTEVIANLIGSLYRGSLEEAVQKAAKRLEGSFALGVVSRKEPDTLIAVRKASPLIIGVKKEGYFLASDIPALLPFTRDIIYLRDGQIAVFKDGKLRVSNFYGETVKIEQERAAMHAQDAEKKGFEHFMLKEISEQPEVLSRTLSLYVKENKVAFPGIHFKEDYLKGVKNVFITACGTAYHAGYVGKYFLEKHCGVDVEIDTSSEFRYRSLNIGKDDLLIAISQSGETADTLAAVQEAKKTGVKVLSICNVLGSSLVKESDSLIYTLAGPEIGVASTKAYTAQLLSIYLFSLYLGSLKGLFKETQLKEIITELKEIPQHQREVIQHADAIKKMARKFSKFGCFLFLGRGINYPSALEGALKLKEISYIPAEGYPAGEMKHGPIALIDEYRGVVCITLRDLLHEKMISNMQEIKARRGKTLGILNYGEKEANLLSDEIIYIPELKNQDFSPLIVAVCLQLFAYYVAKNLGCEIDQPRNLAKSVTVE